MNEILFKSLTFTGGVALGIIFFGGLWLTVRKALASKTPTLWFLGSFIFRVGTVVLGFYWAMQRASWLDGLICLLGFIAARFLIIRLTKTYDAKTGFVKNEMKEVAHDA